MAYPNYGAQPSYPQPSLGHQYPVFAQPVQSSYPYAQAQQGISYGQPAPPQSAYTHDPFRQWYRQQLTTLTFNSRPIIQGLSIAAMERRDRNDWNGMTAVGEELERAIIQAPSTSKLPLLYLLDSISKNVGQPYTTHVFPRFITQAFLTAYSSVDGVTRTKMEEMLRTWRQGGVGGVELFGPDVREGIEAGIFGTSKGGFHPTPTGGIGYIDPVANERQRVGQSLADALKVKRAALARNPGDAEARVHVGVLEQIERLLSMGNVKPEEIREIQAQLDTIRASDNQPLSDVGGSTPDVYAQPQPRHIIDPYAGALKPNSVHLAPPSNSFASTGGNSPAGNFQPGHQRNVSTPTITPSVPAPKMDFGNLLRDLTFAGVIGSNTPTSQQTTPTLARAVIREGSVGSVGSGVVKNSDAGDLIEEEDGLKEYEEMILSMNVSLTLSGLSRNYDFKPTAHLPNRCSQCAARFPAGQTGKDRLQAHLDWHFRRNRKEKENEGRGANRRWLPRAEFWIKDVTSNAVSADGAGALGSSSSKPGLGMAPKVDAAYVAKQREDLQNSWIPVPSDPAKAALPCPICKEKFVSEYNEDEEEWIWMNAIEADGQISHATCRSDAVATAVANRVVTDNKSSLRAESPARSRANTPQAAISVLSVKSPPRNVKENTPTQNASPARSVIPSSLETDVKPTTAILQAADRLNTTVRQLRENSTDSSSSAGVKRKAHEDVDLLKEIKKEKA